MEKPPSPFHLYGILFVFFISTSSKADPRSQTVQVNCSRQFQHNSTFYQPNYSAAMFNLSSQLQSSRSAVAAAGSAPDASYSLAQCYGDLSLVDCQLCFSEARTVLPQCFPSTGGRVFLDGCFLRAENYSFYTEISGVGDGAICSNRTRQSADAAAFRTAVDQAVASAVNSAVNGVEGFGRSSVEFGSGGNGSTAYALANCWETLNGSACMECLQNASTLATGCLAAAEGRGLMAGCFLRYSDFDFLNKATTKGNLKKVVTVVVVVCVVSSLVVLGIGAAIGTYLWRLRRIQQKRKGSYDADRLVETLHDRSLNFKYSTLEKATGSFTEANKLGQGGFGTVYKGVLHDGREIAVKRLFFNNRHRAADFYNEVNIISSVEHKNLVRLLGCSCSGPESLLVYEFLPHRSLDRFIFDQLRGRALNWEKRYEIIIGTAEGLVYLHENKNNRIIHRDIKASNILLDSRLRAKIADFGLARSFEEDKSHISTAIAGTMGYMAPEYLAHGQLTEKADVYSFGVLLLEIITGRQNTKTKPLEYSESLVAIVWRHFQQGTVEELFDSNLILDADEEEEEEEEDEQSITDEIQRAIHVGLLCIQEAPTLRPTMSRALQMLRKKDGHLPTPSNPPFIDERTMELNNICENPCQPLNSDSCNSVATVSYSSFYGR
ncbi:hypothetical protein V2J09_019936 [Rumex salicifolius]